MTTRPSLIVKAGETRTPTPLSVFGNQIRIKLSGEDTGGSFAVFEGEMLPQEGPPLHRHEHEDESFYVLEGHFVFEVDGKLIDAEAGSSVFAPRGTVHRFQNVGATTGRLLTVSQPAGLDAFFVDIDKATNGARRPDLAVVLPIFEKYGLELLGPPMSPRTPQLESEYDLAAAD